MIKELLQINNYVDGINDTPFFSSENPIVITEYDYNANRMGSISVSATFRHKEQLDDLWDGTQYITVRGHMCFIKNVPTSSKDNKDERYKYEIEFISKRSMLDSVYFFDVVTGDTSTDLYKSNSTNVAFFGDLSEFVKRANYSLRYSNVDYSVVIDSGIKTDGKQFTFDNMYMSDAFRNAFEVWGIPFYYAGNVIHFGYSENTLQIPIAYGHDRELLSISKTNADSAIVNRCSGKGSQDNIPFYYPNDYADRKLVEASGKKWITPSQFLMPSIYRKSEGAERFYNALNDAYPIEGGYMIFENTYNGNNPKEHIEDFSDIKPTIEGVKNENGQRIDEIIEFAYDSDDNDNVNESNGEYEHPYFYAKLRRMDGANGFNLFDQAIEGNSPMTISMKTGNCTSCNFEIGVIEKVEKGRTIFQNPVQVDSNGNIVKGSFKDKIKADNIQPQQQNTSAREVWIALKKDDNAFGVIMPNKENGYKPSPLDRFVILYIQLPKAYILAAEKRLDDAILDFMFKNNSNKFNFSIAFSRIYFGEHPEVLEGINENSIILLQYNERQYELYISSFSYRSQDNNPLPDIRVELTDTLVIRKNAIQQAVDKIQGSQSGGGMGTDANINFDRKYLRKDKPDWTRFPMGFYKGITLGDYRENIDGAKIDEQGNAEFESVKTRGHMDSESLTTDKIESHDFVERSTGFEIKTDKATGKSYAEVDELFVRMKAIFTKLDINRLSYSGGNFILSPAGITCSKVENHKNYYRCYFTQDHDGKAIENEFRVNDQVRSEEFNIKSGVYENVSNRYYWRLCVGVGRDYIDLSKTDYDSSSNAEPMVGDAMVCLGNRTDKTRQSAIMFSSFGEGSPSIYEYQGINTYSLLDKDSVRISPESGNKFTGDFVMESGKTIKEYTDESIRNIQIGSRNLLKKSKSIYKKENGSSVISTISAFGTGLWRNDKNWINDQLWKMSNIGITGNEYNHHEFIPTVRLKPNTTYFLSIGSSVSNIGNVKEFTIAIYDESTKQTRYMAVVPVSGERQIVEIKNIEGVVPTNNNKILFYTGIAGMADDKSLTWKEVKLEEGTKYTDWTPAPEDDEEAIDGVINDIKDIQGFNEAINKDIADIKKSIDGTIETWFYDPEPTLDNLPASSWKKEEYHSHIGDLYYSGSGMSYRFLETSPNVYEWKQITDDAISTALKIAKEAKDTADHKRRVFIGDTIPTPPYDRGDLWVNAIFKDASHDYNDDLLRCNVDRASGVFSIDDWVYATKYTDDSTANQALTEVDKTQKDLDAAKKRLEDAENNAKKMQGEISDIVSDKKLTPSEKQILLKEWNTIKAEYIINLATAKTKYKVPYDYYTTAYNNLDNYIKARGIFDAATIDKTTDVNESEFYDMFVRYYDARTTLLDSITIKAKKLADDAQSKADEAWNHADQAIKDAATAQGKADEAWNKAETANAELAKISDDKIISPSEKSALKQQLNDINSEYLGIVADAKEYSVNTTKFVSAYNNAKDALIKYTTNPSEYTNVENDYSDIAAYYTERGVVLQNIAVESKRYAKAAADAASGADTKAQNALDAAANAQSKADSASTDARAANDKLKEWSADNVISPTEKQGIKDEMARILADKNEITDGYTKYGLGVPTDFNNKYKAYNTELQILSSAKPETIAIPSTFNTTQKNYYDARTLAFSTIAGAAKQFVVDKDNDRQEDIRQINVKFEQTDESISGIVTRVGEQDTKIADAVDKAANAETSAGNAAQDALDAQGAADRAEAAAKGSSDSSLASSQSAEASRLEAEKAKDEALKAADSAKLSLQRAEAAEQSATEAAQSAVAATNTLKNIENDNLVSPVEKKSLIQQMNDIKSEYNAVIKDAELYTIKTEGYTNAYNLAILALEKYTKPTPTYIPLDKQLNDFGNIAKYYEARQLILDLIAAATKDYTTTRFDIADGKIEANIRATEVISGRVSTAESDIKQTKDEIATKVGQTEFDSLTGRVNINASHISQNAKAIESKVSQTSFDELSGTVALQESRIEQNAQSISLKVSASEAKDIASEESKKAMDSVQVGVRNLIPHSESLHQNWNNDYDRVRLLSCFSSGVWLMDDHVYWLNDTKWKNDNIGYYGAENNHFESWLTEGILPETPYTLSVGSSSTDGVGCRFYNFALYDYERSAILYMGVLPVSTSRVSTTFITPATINKDHKTQLLLYTGFAGSADHNAMTWQKVKLEQGNKATGWSPSPEEVDRAIKENEEKIASWAADGFFSPTERKGLGEELDRVNKDMSHLISMLWYYGFTSADVEKLQDPSAAYIKQLEHYYAIKGDKAVKIETGFNEAREAYYAAIQEAWDAIDKKSKDSTDKNGSDIAALRKYTDAELSVRDDAINARVTEDVFNALGKRVSEAETNISQKADSLELTAVKTEVDSLTGEVSTVKSQIDVMPEQIILTVTNNLSSAGLSITSDTVKVTADKFYVNAKVKDEGGATKDVNIALFSVDEKGNPSIVASMLNITDGVKIGNFDIKSGWLRYDDDNMNIALGSNLIPIESGATFTLAAYIVNKKPNKIADMTTSNVALTLEAGGADRNVALKTIGDVVVNGSVFETTYATPSGDLLDPIKGTRFYVLNQQSGKVVLPSAENIKKALGRSSGDRRSFCVRISVAVSNKFPYGTCTISRPFGGHLHQPDGKEVDSVRLNQGTSREFLIFSEDGTNSNTHAYLLSL